MTRRKKILLRSGIGLAALALLLAVAVWTLLATEPGTRFLFTRLGALMPGKLETADIEGPIRGPLTVRGLVYETDTMRVAVDRVFLDWDLRDLLRRRIDVHRLHADRVRVLTKPGPERQEPTALPDVNLRFNIVVRDARVRDVELTRPDAERPLRIDEIALDTYARGGEVVVRSLTARGPDFSADARGRVRPQGDYPLDLRVRWAATLPGWPAGRGSAALSGTLEKLRVAHDLALPFRARLDALLTTPLRDLSFDGTVTVARVNPAELKAGLPAVALGGTVRGRGTIAAFTAEGNLDADSDQLGRAAADFRLRRQGAGWIVERLALSSPDAPTTVLARGSVTPGATPGAPLRFDLTADWQELVWPLAGPPAVRSASGRAAASGTPDDYALDLVARLATPQLPPSRWELAGRGSLEALRVDRLRGNLLDGTLSATGRVAWKPEVSWRLAVTGRGLDPRAVVAALPGKLALDARTEGRLAGGGPVGSVAPLRLTGTLRGEALAGGGAVDFAGKSLTLHDLDFAWGSAHLAADGTAGDRWDLDWHVQAPDLGIALDGAGGSLGAHGRLAGPGAAPRVTAVFQGDALTFGTTAVATLHGDADVDLRPDGPLRLDLQATQVAMGERRLASATLRGAGRRDAHRIEAVLLGEENRLTLGLDGGLAGTSAWRGAITTLDLRSDFAGAWGLAAPAPLTASASGGDLRDLCWVSGASRLCATGAWSPTAGWRVDSTLADLPLSLAKPFLPPDLELTGDVDGAVLARADAAGRLAADVDIAPGPGELAYTGPDGERAAVRYEQARLTVDAGPSGVDARAGVTLVDVGNVAGELHLPDYNVKGLPARDQAVRGRVQADLADLSFVQALAPGLERTAGRLDADLALAGSVARPLVSGEARLTVGAAEVPAFGLELADVQLAAISAGDPVIRIEGGARSGPGRVTITGQATLAPTAETPIRLAIDGDRFQAMNTKEARVFVSPDIDVLHRGDRIDVTGEVRVPEAVIDVQKRRQAGAVPVSQDVVIVSGEGETPQRRNEPPLHARLRVVLGDDVEVKAFGLVAEPRGSLLVIEEPGTPTRAIGEIDIDGGTFKAYGQDLTIERGRLIFAGGPLANPALSLRAYRRADDGVVAGLNARGRLQQPEITLWSDPAMGQSEQLSYLLLGRPLQRATPAEGSLVANAATSLGVKGGNLLAKRLGARFGLEEARIETEGSLEEASLVLGKYLSPRLYVSYGFGLFDPVNILRLRYLLDEQWTIQAETGAGTSADVLYSTERGRGAAVADTVRRAPSDAETPRRTPSDGDRP